MLSETMLGLAGMNPSETQVSQADPSQREADASNLGAMWIPPGTFGPPTQL